MKKKPVSNPFIYFSFLAAMALSSCDQAEIESVIDQTSDDVSSSLAVSEIHTDTVNANDANSILQHVLSKQDEQTVARYPYRHPDQVINFFGLEPGMTVMEALPGGGWYSKILLPYLGKDGHLIGADYPSGIWPYFEWASDEFIAERASWTETWAREASAWKDESSAKVSAMVYGNMPEEHIGTVDAVLFIRALHNMARFNDEAFLKMTLADSYQALKPGGVVGVVQHQAREDKDDQWANGSRGYLKKTQVIAMLEQAGFELVAESDVNENPLDQPGEDDIVWRLPPSYGTSHDNEQLRAEMQAVGESHRMTLLFKKPL